MRICICLLCGLWCSGILSLPISEAANGVENLAANTKTTSNQNAQTKPAVANKNSSNLSDTAGHYVEIPVNTGKPISVNASMQAKIANYWQQARLKLDSGRAWNVDSTVPTQRLSFAKAFDILVGLNVDMDLQLDPVVQLIDPEDAAEFKFVPADYNLLNFSSKLLEVNILPDVFFLPQVDAETADQGNKPTFKQQESMCQTKQWKVIEMVKDPSDMQYITICGQDRNSQQPKSFISIMRFVALKEQSIFSRYRRVVLLYILMDKPFDIHKPKQLKAAEANAKQLLANLNNAVICSAKLQHNPAVCERYRVLWEATSTTTEMTVETGEILEND